MMAIEPITRKEKFLAKAGGQSVEELKPITREEMFLSKISGGGGSSVQPDLSQNDPNAPDYVKGKENFAQQIGGSSKVIVEKTITIPQGTQMIKSAKPMHFIPFGLNEFETQKTYRLIDGETYVLKLPNGDEHTATAFKDSPLAPVSLFVDTASSMIIFEDVGSRWQCISYIGEGISAGWNGADYGISGRFEEEDTADNTLRFEVSGDSGLSAAYINGKKVEGCLGFLGNSEISGLRTEITYLTGSTNVAEFAYPMSIYVHTSDDNSIDEATMKFIAYSTWSTTPNVRSLNLLTGGYTDV